MFSVFILVGGGQSVEKAFLISDMACYSEVILGPQFRNVF